MRQRELDEVSRGTACGVCAFEGITPVGYAVYHRTVQTYHLDTIAVDQSRQGAGIGSALLEGICTDLKRTGPTILNVVTDASAQAALRFYLDRGFFVAGYVRDEFLLGVTQAHLTREIR
jgi:ribosomal protein S18 acetylase RimI-like enzyme